MTVTPLDVLAGTSCSLVPGTIEWGPGWYLVAANARVEAGPFPTEEAAHTASVWMWEHAWGVHPCPWEPRYSASALVIGSRVRQRSKVPIRVQDDMTQAEMMEARNAFRRALDKGQEPSEWAMRGARQYDRQNARARRASRVS